MSRLSSQSTVWGVIHDGTDSSDSHSDISTRDLKQCDRKKKTHQARSKMAPAKEDAELPHSHEQKQICMDIGSNYSCETREC